MLFICRARPRNVSQAMARALQTSEINLNYIIKQFNARVMFFYIDQRWDLNPSRDTWRAGAGLQLQM